MHSIELIINCDVSIKVKVPDRDRFTAYQPILQRAADTLFSSLNPIVNLENTSLPSQLLAHLAQFLDEITLYILDCDLESYCKKTPPWHNRDGETIQSSSLSKEESRTKLTEYFSALPEGLGEHFKQATNANGELVYPDIEAIYTRISNLFVDNCQRILQRLQKDLPLLQQVFCTHQAPDYVTSSTSTSSSDGNSEHAHFSLSAIHFTDSDRHEQGQQVAILEFTQGTIKKKIVYKTHSMLMSALICGNTAPLRRAQLITQGQPWTTACSLWECVNQARSKGAALPTHCILPIEGETLDECYGYEEYLEHDLQNEDIAGLVHENRFKGKGSIQRIVTQYQNSCLQQLAVKAGDTAEHCQDFADWPYQCVAPPGDAAKEFIERWSFQCGAITLLSRLFGITDLHCENIRQYLCQPFIIDCEVAFSTSVNNIDSTSLFEAATGAFRHDAKTGKAYPCLVDMNGVSSNSVLVAEKNRMYQLVRQGAHYQLVPCPLDMQAFKKGYKSTLYLLRQQGAESISRWLECHFLKNACMRTLPIDTSDFIRFSAPAETLSLQKTIEDQTRMIVLDIAAFLEDEISFEHILDRTIYGQLVYLHSHTLGNFLSMSIPVFYCRMQSHELFDALGNTVKIDPTLFSPLLQEKIRNFNAKYTYLAQTPHKFFTAQFQSLLDGRVYFEQLGRELKELIANLGQASQAAPAAIPTSTPAPVCEQTPLLANPHPAMDDDDRTCVCQLL